MVEQLTPEEQKANILKTASAIEAIIRTEGWKYIQEYIAVRVNLLKNEIAKADLSNIAEASKKQGEIIGLNRPLGRINHVLFKARQIKEERLKEKSKEKKKK